MHQGPQLSFLLLFSLDALGLWIKTVPEISRGNSFGLCSFSLAALSLSTSLSLRLADFLIDFLLDLGELLLYLLIGIIQNEQALSLMLQLPRVVVGLLLQAHGLSLVKAVPRGHKFIV